MNGETTADEEEGGELTGTQPIPDAVRDPDREVIAAKEQAENFPVALRFLPKRVRADLGDGQRPIGTVAMVRTGTFRRHPISCSTCC